MRVNFLVNRSLFRHTIKSLAGLSLLAASTNSLALDPPAHSANSQARIDRCELSVQQALKSIRANALPRGEFGEDPKAVATAKAHNAARPKGADHAKLIKATNEQEKIWAQLSSTLREFSLAQRDSERNLGKIDSASIRASAKDLQGIFASLLAHDINSFDNQKLREALGIPNNGEPVSVMRDPRTVKPGESPFKEIPKELDIEKLLISGRLNAILRLLNVNQTDSTISTTLQSAVADSMRVRVHNRNKVAIPTFNRSVFENELSSAPILNTTGLQAHLQRKGGFYQGLWNARGDKDTQWETSIQSSPMAARQELNFLERLDPDFTQSTGIQYANVFEVSPKVMLIGNNGNLRSARSAPLNSIQEALEILKSQHNIVIDPNADINQQLQQSGLTLVPIWKTGRASISN
ncbi:hypothetical protein GW915_08420 [bacterium]|nr:hypothetical protein [bacterium]